MDWSKVKRVPKYNPAMFQLARELDGMPKGKFAKRAGLSLKRYSDIEAGNVEPTEDEVIAITKSQTHVIIEFFEQWPHYELDTSRGYGINVFIDYFRYKIFRDLNPPPLRVA